MKRPDVPTDVTRRMTAADAERLFTDRIRRALDESVAALPESTVARLALARKAALRAQPSPGERRAPVGELAFAGSGSRGGGSRNGFRNDPQRLGYGRAGLVCTAVLLVGACLAGLYQFEQDRRIEELADMDTAVLNDDLPISAYTDQGFNAFLKQNP